MDVHFHSDGNIIDIIPDLIDMGVRVINCQANVIGLDLLKKRFAGAICFRTDLDRQKIMPFGTPLEVKRHVVDVFEPPGHAEGRHHRLRRGGPRTAPGEHQGHVRGLCFVLKALSELISRCSRLKLPFPPW